MSQRAHLRGAVAPLADLPGRAWTRIGRPVDAYEATRWLFLVLAAASVVLALPGVAAGGTGRPLLVTILAALVLVLSWSAGYLLRRAPIALDAVDALAFAVFAVAGPTPTLIFAAVFASLWFRSLYGSTRGALLRCTLYVVVLATFLPAGSRLVGRPAIDIAPLVAIIPTMFLTVVIARHLAAVLRGREQAAQLDAVHVKLGSQLLGVTDADEIRRLAWAAKAGICAALPGLRVLKVARGGGKTLRVEGATGAFVGIPPTLSAALVAPGDADDSASPWPVRAGGELDDAVGVPLAWVCVPMPTVHAEHGQAWLLLGSPGRVPDEAIVAIVSLANEITLALRNSEVHQELTIQATFDSLTGLANRSSFNAALKAALRDTAAGPSTVLFIDLDDFKDVNDVLGHAAGDELLREVAVRLRQCTGPDDVRARLGGDEFAILMRGVSAGAAAEVAQRIVSAIAEPADLVGGVAHVGASVGVATTESETDVEQLVQRADVAMYAAKANGKGRIQVFEPGLLKGDSSQARFEQQLTAAPGNGELVVHYQPVLSLPDGRCTAVEALVRWQHPDRGLLPPADFIEIAERIGAIKAIGAYVLRQSCADAATWCGDHPANPLAVHVNISALQLDDDSFVTDVARCLADFDMAPDRLVLEVTETIVISSPHAIARLNTLAAMGVTIAIDDFGTGYSALTTLRTLPAKIVKIDRSFVAGATVNPQDRAVTEAVVTMAAKMGLQTIAEGVERIDQQEYLRSIGADSVQGYLYLRPTSAQEFAVWFDAHLAGVPVVGATSRVVIPFPPLDPARRSGAR